MFQGRVIGGFQHRRNAFQANPGETRPVLVPTVDQHRHARARTYVAYARKLSWVCYRLSLLIERRVENQAVGFVAKRESDGHGSWPAVGRERHQNCPSSRLQQLALRRLEQGYASAILTELMVTGTTGLSPAPVLAPAILSSTSSPEVSRPKIV